MGRYNFAATRVRASATYLLSRGRLTEPPPWYDITAAIPPSQALVRPLQARRQPWRGKNNTKKASKLFQPSQIVYPEDNVRQQFFADHPWELARPRVVLENDGNDAKGWDWGRGVVQEGKPLDGESVVQRQLWLMKNKKQPKSGSSADSQIDRASGTSSNSSTPRMSQNAAYDQARHEFYQQRHLEAVARRVAIEEAMSTGAYFGKSALAVSEELEDAAWEDWKVWATAETARAQTMRAAQYGPVGAVEDEETAKEQLGAFEAEIAETAGGAEKTHGGSEA